MALSYLAFWGGARPLTILTPARDASARALQLAPELADAHVAEALLATFNDRDLPTASRAFDRAVSLAPHNTYARAGRAQWVLAGARRNYDAADAEMKRVVERDPLSAYAFALQSNTAKISGRFEESIAPAVRSVELDPMSHIARMALVHSHFCCGNHGAAVEAAHGALAISGRHSWALALLADAFAATGHVDRARAILTELTARSEYAWVLPTDLAIASLACGLTDEAVRHVERGFAECDPRIISLDLDNWPDLRQLRNSTSYAALRERVGWAT
jgi:tetratricopeptide (TPR) repeat protein